MATINKTKANESDLFDNSAGYDDDRGIRFAPDLTEEERHQATSLYRLFNGLWGLCTVKGDPGTGKDLFGNYITYKLKRFFPHKRMVRDEKPRNLFGAYDGLFDEQVIIDDLKQMKEIAKGTRQSKDEEEVKLEQAADDWVQGAGQVLLKNSILYLTEFWRYCYNREPHNPMNKTMGAIHKVKRHLDCLIIGTTQLTEDLDRKTCLPWIDWQVTCTRSRINKTTFTYFVQKVKYDRRLSILMPIGKPFPIRFDAGKPRSDMGNGLITILKPKYLPESEEERIILDLIKEGYNKYESILEFLYEHGDMTEYEILETLKNLSFIPRKHVIDYPCYFRLYNSKSAPQVKTSLKLTE